MLAEEDEAMVGDGAVPSLFATVSVRHKQLAQVPSSKLVNWGKLETKKWPHIWTLSSAQALFEAVQKKCQQAVPNVCPVWPGQLRGAAGYSALGAGEPLLSN